MRQVVVACLLKKRRVMLGIKQAGPFKNLYTLPGGKADSGESRRATVVREVYEEVGIRVAEETLYESARVALYIDDVPEFMFHIYTTWIWKGQPKDTTELASARMFRFHQLPLKQMVPTDTLWLPKVLRGELFTAKIFRTGGGDIAKDPVFKNRSRYHPYKGPAE